MAFYTQNMLELALELALHDPMYEDMAVKFIEHFFWITGAMDRMGETADELWDEEDGFFYDVLRLPDGTAMRLKVRSLVGLLPLCATSVIPKEFLDRFPRAAQRIRQFLQKHAELAANLRSTGRSTRSNICRRNRTPGCSGATRTGGARSSSR